MRRLLPLFAAAALAGCGVNTIPAKEETAKAKWADVQNQYQRRADLIPNLVATVQGAATQERTVLREVTEARANATRITVTGDQLSDPQAMARFAEAQGRLNISLQRLQEAYPNLQANENFRDLQGQIEGTENRIQVARRDYNEAVRDYNTEIRTFPSIIGARIIHGAKPLVPFEATTPGAERAPTVRFDTGSPAPAGTGSADAPPPAPPPPGERPVTTTTTVQ